METVVVALLTVLADQDLRSREIEGIWLTCFPVIGLLRAVGAAAAPQVLLWRGETLFLSLIPGAFLLAVSWLTGEAVGEGDALVFLGLGFVLPAAVCFRLLFLSCVMTGLEAGILFLTERKRKKTVAFLPLVLLALLLETGEKLEMAAGGGFG